jgi:hypothetical protein
MSFFLMLRRHVPRHVWHVQLSTMWRRHCKRRCAGPSHIFVLRVTFVSPDTIFSSLCLPAYHHCTFSRLIAHTRPRYCFVRVLRYCGWRTRVLPVQPVLRVHIMMRSVARRASHVAKAPSPAPSALSIAHFVQRFVLCVCVCVIYFNVHVLLA